MLITRSTYRIISNRIEIIFQTNCNNILNLLLLRIETIFLPNVIIF